MKSLLGLIAVFPATILLSGWTHGVAVPVDGLSATRARVDNALDMTNRQMMTRSGHYARANISQIKLMLANFYTLPSGAHEAGTGSAATVTASIEYPQGTCTALKFAGSSSGSIANLNTTITDYLTISIPSGSRFWVRLFYTSATGIAYTDPAGTPAVIEDTAGGDAMTVAVSGLTDQTTSCTSVTDSGVGLHFPLAIISPIVQPSVCIYGDSIAWFLYDSYSGNTGDVAEIARSVGSRYGYTNLALGADNIDNFIATHAQRVKPAAYCSSVIIQYGINNFDNAQSVATIETNLNTIYGYFSSNKGVYQTTMLPRTTSTDGYATTINQTPISPESANLVQFNSDLMGGAPFAPKSGGLDLRSAVGTGTNNQLWQPSSSCSGSACTPDGLHPSHNADLNIQTSGVIGTLQ